MDDLVYRYGVSAVLSKVLRTIERNSARTTTEPDERAALDTLSINGILPGSKAASPRMFTPAYRASPWPTSHQIEQERALDRPQIDLLDPVGALPDQDLR
jgi:hypothetical protein